MFERLGIAMDDIATLKPDELFFRILKAAQDQDLDARRYDAFARILGEEAANAALPYAQNPEAMQKAFDAMGWRSLADSISKSTTLDVLGIAELAGMEPLELLRPYMRSMRQPFEPFSRFGIQSEDKANDMAEQNRQRLLLITRSQLSDEERINEALRERARLEGLITAERDPEKRQKLITNALTVEAELAALGRKGSEASGGFARTTDPLRSIGADFGRYSPSVQTRLAEQTVGEIRNLRQTVSEGLSRIESQLREESL